MDFQNCECFTIDVVLQSPGAGGKPQTVSRSSSVSELVSTAEPLDCDWSEHTCPDGYKYYYNCATCESRVTDFYST